MLDSQNSLSHPGMVSAENRDNKREIPVFASSIDSGAVLAGYALDIVADGLLVHRGLFVDPPVKRSAITWPRQVAIELVMRCGLRTAHAAAGFGVDHSTIKAARRAVARRELADRAFAADIAGWQSRLADRARCIDPAGAS